MINIDQWSVFVDGFRIGLPVKHLTNKKYLYSGVLNRCLLNDMAQHR